MEEKISWRGREIRLNGNDHSCSCTTSEFTMWFYLFKLSWSPPFWGEWRSIRVMSKTVSAMGHLCQRKVAVLPEDRGLGPLATNKTPRAVTGTWFVHSWYFMQRWMFSFLLWVASALCHPALSQVIPSLPGQRGATNRSSVSGTELLSGHSLLPAGPEAKEGLKWKYDPNQSKRSQSISHRNFN